MKGRGVILFSIILLFSSYSYAQSMCNELGGTCYFEHELQMYHNNACPDRIPRGIGGLEGEELCSGYGDAEIVGGSIIDITGLATEGVVCCLPDLPPEEPVCGDREINQDSEECDGNNFGGKTCSDFGNFNRGSLACNNLCEIDTGDCSYQPEGIDLNIYVITNVIMCPEDSENIRLILTNNGIRVDNVYLYDTVFYDQNCDGIGSRYLDYNNVFNCGSIEYQDSCIKSYNIKYYYPGCYYHNVYASEGEINFIGG